MTQLVGILNITPDSFSGDGLLHNEEQIATAIQECIDAGADIIDIGAESTRPDATPLSYEEEWARLEPVLQLVKERFNRFPFSLDSYHHENVRRACEMEAIAYINDVNGFNSLEMINVARDFLQPLVVMHSLSVPANKSLHIPENEDVITYLLQWMNERAETLGASGIQKDRIIFDAGLGFGKTSSQSLEILKRIDELQSSGFPIYIGHSRKSFLSALDHPLSSKKDIETLAISDYLISKKVDYIRLHNVSMHTQFLHTKQVF